jgi:hypothetical protein
VKVRVRFWALLLEAQRHKPEGRGFDSRLCDWNFFYCGTGSDSAPEEYHDYFLGVKAAGADCLKIWEP